MSEYEVERMVVRLVGDTSQFTKPFSAAIGLIKYGAMQVGSAGTVVAHAIASVVDFGAVMENMLQSLAKKMGVFGGVLSAVFGGVTYQMVQSAGQFEQTFISFDVLLGGAQKAMDLLGNLTKFAAETPFEMPEVESAARGLVQFGERGDELMQSLKDIGNAASGTKTDFSMIALIYNQIRGVGHLLTQDFRQLSTRGILSLQDLADHFKVPLEEAQKMLSNGKITFADVKAIFHDLSTGTGRFTNLMERQSKSLLGLWSTLKDAINILAREIGETILPAFKMLTQAALYLTEVFSGMPSWLKTIAGYVVVFGGALGLLAGAFASVVLVGMPFALMMVSLARDLLLVRTVAMLATGNLGALKDVILRLTTAMFPGTKVGLRLVNALEKTAIAGPKVAKGLTLVRTSIDGVLLKSGGFVKNLSMTASKMALATASAVALKGILKGLALTFSLAGAAWLVQIGATKLGLTGISQEIESLGGYLSQLDMAATFGFITETAIKPMGKAIGALAQSILNLLGIFTGGSIARAAGGLTKVGGIFTMLTWKAAILGTGLRTLSKLWNFFGSTLAVEATMATFKWAAGVDKINEVTRANIAFLEAQTAKIRGQSEAIREQLGLFGEGQKYKKRSYIEDQLKATETKLAKIRQDEAEIRRQQERGNEDPRWKGNPKWLNDAWDASAAWMYGTESIATQQENQLKELAKQRSVLDELFQDLQKANEGMGDKATTEQIKDAEELIHKWKEEAMTFGMKEREKAIALAGYNNVEKKILNEMLERDRILTAREKEAADSKMLKEVKEKHKEMMREMDESLASLVKSYKDQRDQLKLTSAQLGHSLSLERQITSLYKSGALDEQIEGLRIQAQYQAAVAEAEREYQKILEEGRQKGRLDYAEKQAGQVKAQMMANAERERSISLEGQQQQLAKRGAQLMEQYASPLEKYKKSLKELRQLRSVNAIDDKTMTIAILGIQDEFKSAAEAVGGLTDEIKKLYAQFSNNKAIRKGTDEFNEMMQKMLINTSVMQALNTKPPEIAEAKTPFQAVQMSPPPPQGTGRPAMDQFAASGLGDGWRTSADGRKNFPTQTPPPRIKSNFKPGSLFEDNVEAPKTDPAIQARIDQLKKDRESRMGKAKVSREFSKSWDMHYNPKSGAAAADRIAQLKQEKLDAGMRTKERIAVMKKEKADQKQASKAEIEQKQLLERVATATERQEKKPTLVVEPMGF